MRNPLIAVGVTGLVLAVSTSVGWNVALAVVVLAALTGLAVAGLLRRGQPIPVPNTGRAGTRQAWQDWNTGRVSAGRLPIGQVLGRIPELLAATAGGIVEAIRRPRRTSGPGPFRRRYGAVLGRRSTTGQDPPPTEPVVVTEPTEQPRHRKTAAAPGGYDRPTPPTTEPIDPDRDNGAAPAQKEAPRMTTTTSSTAASATGALGTAGRASISGLVVDWETSVQAREHPETFVAWLQAQAAAARHASTLVPDLVKQFHGRGPSGHAGVPDQIIDIFAKGFEDARTAEADAYSRFAAEYAAYVEQAEAELTHSYGREVLASAHDAHQNRT